MHAKREGPTRATKKSARTVVFAAQVQGRLPEIFHRRGGLLGLRAGRWQQPGGQAAAGAPLHAETKHCCPLPNKHFSSLGLSHEALRSWRLQRGIKESSTSRTRRRQRRQQQQARPSRTRPARPASRMPMTMPTCCEAQVPAGGLRTPTQYSVTKALALAHHQYSEKASRHG
jgi:hypothetical protein